MNITLPRYYDRYDSNPNYKDYKKLLFRAKDVAQSAEMNELQDVLHKEINDLASRVLINGSIVSGAAIKPVRVPNGFDILGNQKYDYTFNCTDGILFVDTYFLYVDEITYNKNGMVPKDFNTTLGVSYKYEVVTDATDADLKNPAVESKNYGQPGAARLKLVGNWIFEEDFTSLNGEIYLPIFKIVKGNFSAIAGVNPWDKDIKDIVARYDRNSNGNYVIEGYETSFLHKDSDLGPFYLNVTEGNANVYGYNYDTDISQTIEVNPLVDFELKQAEPIFFTSDMTYTTRHSPIRKVFRVSGQKQVQESINHGGYDGASDELQNQPVLSVLRVWQGNASDPYDTNNTVYAETTDYIVNGDFIDWSPSGAEPAPGDTYYVIYKYQYTEVEGSFSTDPVSGNTMGQIVDKDKVFLFGFAANTTVSVDYDFVLERTDTVYMDSQGNIQTLIGIPDEAAPQAPVIADKGSLLKLAEVRLAGDADPYVTNDSQRVFRMSDIQSLLETTNNNQYNIAKLALKESLRENQPASIFRNSFVDDFTSDVLRDEEDATNGILNDAITVGGNLVLEVDWTNIYNGVLVDIDTNHLQLDLNSSEVVISQPYYSKVRQINEYLFRAAPPATVTVSPKIYRWITKTTYSSFVRSIQTGARTTWSWRWGWWGWWGNRTTVSREILGSRQNTSTSIKTSSTPVIIPQINLTVTSEQQDFDANEPVEVYFDNNLIQTVNADGNGKVNTSFQIPANTYSGAKSVNLKGQNSQVKGASLFLSIPLVKNITRITTQYWRWLYRRYWWDCCNGNGGGGDPVAQSFVATGDFAIDGIKVYFDTLPTTRTTVLLTETTAGLPDKTKTLASKDLEVSQLIQGDAGTYFQFETKPTVTKNTEYAFIVLCHDTIGKVRVAKLGDRDISHGKWLTSQAYNVGVFFNSSNNAAWSPIQDEDMQFEIHKAIFETSKTIDLTTVNVTNATDLMITTHTKIEPNTNVKFKINLLDRSTNNVFDKVNAYNQIGLDTAYTGRVQVQAMLEGDGIQTPLMDPDSTLSVGITSHTSHYTSRQFDVESDITIMDAYIDANIPINASVTMEYQDYDSGSDTYSWVAIPNVVGDTKPIGNNWNEYHYRLTGITAPDNNKTRIRLTLSTVNDTDRPVVANLRFTAQKV